MILVKPLRLTVPKSFKGFKKLYSFPCMLTSLCCLAFACYTIPDLVAQGNNHLSSCDASAWAWLTWAHCVPEVGCEAVRSWLVWEDLSYGSFLLHVPCCLPEDEPEFSHMVITHGGNIPRKRKKWTGLLKPSSELAQCHFFPF